MSHLFKEKVYYLKGNSGNRSLSKYKYVLWSFPISLFLKELLLSHVNIYDYESVKNSNENG